MELFTSKLLDYHPTLVEPKTLYGIGRDGVPHILLFVCPCGCAKEISINLRPSFDPAWKISQHDDHTLSLYPAIRLRAGCNSTIGISHNQVCLNGV